MRDSSELTGWEPFIGLWRTEARHPAFPGVVVPGTSTFEWLEGRRFVIWRIHHEHPALPDALSVIGVTDGAPSMHYFDSRGVYRVYASELDGTTWRFSRAEPGMSQRYVVTNAGETMSVSGELSSDGSTWEPDLSVVCRRDA